MRKLLLFLARYSIVGLFLLLETVSFALFVSNGRYPKSVFFSSSNGVVARLYQVSAYVSDFFKLRADNRALSEENARLKNRLARLENRLDLALIAAAVDTASAVTDTSRFVRPELERDYIAAHVINNSTDRARNYMTLNRGAADGIRPDMGVAGPEGVVGIVRTVSERFSTVISLLNPVMQVNCKIKRNNYHSPLSWDNSMDYRHAQLTDIPRHVDLCVGDTIITSGLTTAFPEGIPVGVIENFSIGEGDAFYTIEVRLATDFRRLSRVNVIGYRHYEEQTRLEEALEQ